MVLCGSWVRRLQTGEGARKQHRPAGGRPCPPPRKKREKPKKERGGGDIWDARDDLQVAAQEEYRERGNEPQRRHLKCSSGKR